MDHEAVLGMALGGVHFEGRRSRRDQHLARSRSGGAQFAEHAAHAAARADHLVAVGRIRRCLNDAHTPRIRAELVDHEHRKRGRDALADLGLGEPDRRHAALVDGDERPGREGLLARRHDAPPALLAAAQAQPAVDADAQRRSAGHAAEEKLSSRQPHERHDR
jgi:hypothetical protein